MSTCWESEIVQYNSACSKMANKYVDDFLGVRNAI